MHYYESMVIFNPELTEKNVNEANKKITDLVNSLTGKIVETEYKGKRTLAYQIEKKREGHYLINYFTLPPMSIGKVENHYRLSENILRYNIIRLEDKDFPQEEK